MVTAMSVVRRLTAGVVVVRATTTAFERPDRLPRALLAMAPWGASMAALVAGAAARYPDRAAVIDDDGPVTYSEIWRRANALAAGLAERGIGPGSKVGLLCRNHRGFLEALTASAMVGADVVFLNTGFAGPQLAAVIADEGITVVIHDDEFAPLVGTHAGITILGEVATAQMAAAGTRVRPKRTKASMVVLTSGTTGRPKGAARRSDPAAIEGVAAVLKRVPYRLGDTQVIAAPLFHGWGLTNLLLGISRCSTNVMSRRFDPESTLMATAAHRADVLVVVPVMLSRILGLPDPTLARLSTPKLRVIASSGSALGSKLVSDALDRFGPVLYNLYGSTEVAVATIATPEDLRSNPSTAGRVAFGVRVEILDDQGNPVPDGSTGRVFVGGSMRFEGYTTGGGKEQLRGLLSSGDLGHFDGGLLFLEGREDDMIVSGGENVFPVEIEELLANHPAIAEVAVVGIPDAEYGQVLAAFVVRRRGERVTADEVRSHARHHLARFKVPRHVEFLEALPRNETGKVLRRNLVIRSAAKR